MKSYGRQRENLHGDQTIGFIQDYSTAGKCKIL